MINDSRPVLDLLVDPLERVCALGLGPVRGSERQHLGVGTVCHGAIFGNSAASWSLRRDSRAASDRDAHRERPDGGHPPDVRPPASARVGTGANRSPSGSWTGESQVAEGTPVGGWSCSYGLLETPQAAGRIGVDHGTDRSDPRMSRRPSSGCAPAAGSASGDSHAAAAGSLPRPLQRRIRARERLRRWSRRWEARPRCCWSRPRR
jgi:hypothetical protein